MGISLADLEKYSEIDPRVQFLSESLGVNNYDEFVKALYNCIDWCVTQIQNEKKYLQPDRNGEDRVTAFLRNSLKGFMYTADAKFMGGGNTDLTITSFNKKYEWIGEAKIVDCVNNTHVWDGFLQLVTRYTNGNVFYSPSTRPLIRYL